MNYRSFTSLMTHFALLLAVVMVPVIGYVAWTLLLDRAEQRQYAAERAVTVTSGFAQLQEQIFSDSRTTVASLARLPQVRQMAAPDTPEARECSQVLVDQAAVDDLYSNFQIADLDGQIWCSTFGPGLAINVAERPYFQEVVTTRSFAVSPYLRSLVTGLPVMIVGYPVYDDDGTFAGVLTASFGLAWFNQALRNINLPRGTTVMVLDETGTVMAHHPDTARWTGQTISPDLLAEIRPDGEDVREVIGARADGTESLLVSAPLSSLMPGVFVSVAIPTEVAFAAAADRFIQNLIIITFFGVAMLVLLWVLARTLILNRLGSLSAVTRRLAEGDVSARTGLPPMADEIGQLAAAFDSMAESLQVSREELSQSRARYQTLVRSLQEGVIMYEADGSIVTHNRSAETILGLTAGQIGQALGRPGSPGDPPPPGWSISDEAGSPLDRSRKPTDIALATGQTQPPTLFVVQKPGESPVWIQVTAIPLFDSGEPAPVAAVASIRDVTSLRDEQTVLTHKATHDALTGLPNRMLFLERLEKATAESRRTGELVAVVFMDLDNFKSVNDTYGHAAGDDLLRQVAARLIDSLRSSDTAARFGGDEYTALIPGLADEDAAVRAADRLLEAFMQPFRVGGTDRRISTSFGIALAPRDGLDPEGLMADADSALYRAKLAGKNTYRFSSLNTGGQI